MVFLYRLQHHLRAILMHCNYRSRFGSSFDLSFGFSFVSSVASFSLRHHVRHKAGSAAVFEHYCPRMQHHSEEMVAHQLLDEHRHPARRCRGALVLESNSITSSAVQPNTYNIGAPLVGVLSRHQPEHDNPEASSLEHREGLRTGGHLVSELICGSARA